MTNVGIEESCMYQRVPQKLRWRCVQYAAMFRVSCAHYNASVTKTASLQKPSWCEDPGLPRALRAILSSNICIYMPGQGWTSPTLKCFVSHSPSLGLVSIGYIVVGGRVFDIAGGRPNIYIVVYIHRIYKWYVRYVYSIYGGPPAKTKSQKWRPPTTMIGYTWQKLLINWAIVQQTVYLQVVSCLCTTNLSLVSGIAHLPFGIVLANIFLLCSFRGSSNLCSGLKTC